jgi:Mg2+ and Co2+ transporter CorA
MSDYLENEVMRRQNESVVRLTVVTAFGLVVSVATGFLGMNLFDLTAHGDWMKMLLFAVVFVPIALLTFYTIKKSRRLSDFLDAIADESADLTAKWQAFRRIW